MLKLKQIQNNQEFNNALLNSEVIFNDILNACNNQWMSGCGSYLFEGHIYEYNLEMYDKQLLIYNKAKESKCVLEIGTYMGHSLLLMLLANPTLNITCIDISDTYTKPSVEVLKKYFPNANINFIHGDSLSVIKELDRKFDFFHIDGRHEYDYIKEEFEICKSLCVNEYMNIIFDDFECCKDIETIIKTNHTVIEHITPNCKYTNTFFKIKL